MYSKQSISIIGRPICYRRGYILHNADKLMNISIFGMILLNLGSKNKCKVSCFLYMGSVHNNGTSQAITIILCKRENKQGNKINEGIVRDYITFHSHL